MEGGTTWLDFRESAFLQMGPIRIQHGDVYLFFILFFYMSLAMHSDEENLYW